MDDYPENSEQIDSKKLGNVFYPLHNEKDREKEFTHCTLQTLSPTENYF